MNSCPDKNNDNIASIDKNFERESVHDENGPVYHDVRKSPFRIYGLYGNDKAPFKRMPEEVAGAVSDGVCSLNFNTAGGRVRFKTDSRYIAVKCTYPALRKMAHMSLTGSAGFDMYSVVDGYHRYEGTFIPKYEDTDGFVAIKYFQDVHERDIVINFPTYGRVDDLFIGVEATSFLGEGGSYRYEKPVLYYGTSVTQGGCSSRAGTNYQSIISQRLDCDFINLGFSGSAKGEEAIVDYLTTIDASVFVCDYDYNTPSVEHLEKTHLPIYLKYRRARPDTPIIFVSAPLTQFERLDRLKTLDMIKRRAIVFKTYMYAIENGDMNVGYIDGYAMFAGFDRSVYTVDGVHPNDAGFLRMADVIGGEIRQKLIK